jgi:hypothetical protein
VNAAHEAAGTRDGARRRSSEEQQSSKPVCERLLMSSSISGRTIRERQPSELWPADFRWGEVARTRPLTLAALFDRIVLSDSACTRLGLIGASRQRQIRRRYAFRTSSAVCIDNSLFGDSIGYCRFRAPLSSPACDIAMARVVRVMPQNLAYAGHTARAARILRTSMAEAMASSPLVNKRARFEWHTLVVL